MCPVIVFWLGRGRTLWCGMVYCVAIRGAVARCGAGCIMYGTVWVVMVWLGVVICFVTRVRRGVVSCSSVPRCGYAVSS